MYKTRSLLVILTVLLTLGGASVALGQTPFATFEVKAELSQPPEPVAPAALTVQIAFVPGPPSDGINPATEVVTVEIQPPDPVQPPDPIQPGLTAWRLQLPIGCFMERANGQFRVEDSVACGASLELFFEDSTSLDLSEQISSLDASFKPPSGNKSDWRYRLDLELETLPPSPILPPNPVVPPDPVRSSTLLMIGDDVGEASHSFVRWEGTQQEDVCPPGTIPPDCLPDPDA